jgi:two-component system response regulator PilR (NtrC family)
MKSPIALIVDDEPDIRELLQITLKRMDINSQSVESLGAARQLLKQQNFNICLTDMRLPDGDGLDFVSYVQEHYPNMPVAMITAHGNMETAIQALKSGAFDFLTKPVDLGLLRTLVRSALKLSEAHSPAKRRLVGESRQIQEIRNAVKKLARSQAPIFISGESGTGKELVARMIHETGPRASCPFIPVNCGAIPHDLLESEFFGHMKGSFTGAVADKEGLFKAAEGGTLFLDEIAELPQHMQVKLLRVIQEKSMRPIGATRELPVDVRILSATHADLKRLTESGKFRQDLFYRINVIELKVTPLRERRDDIPLLISYLLEKLADGMDYKPRLSDAALQALEQYNYPGNVRELENILERASTLCEDGVIKPEDLQLPTSETAHQIPQEKNVTQEKKAALDEYLGDIEKQTILETLEKTKWNRTAAAKLLGISLRALRYRLEKLGLD